MKYAVIDISGHQSIVSENDTITIDNVNSPIESKLKTDKVLLIVNDDDVLVGTPQVENAQVSYEIVKHHKGQKIRVFKYKAKSRYRKTKGFRAKLTDIKITKIEVKKTKAKTKSKPKIKAKTKVKTIK